MYKQATLTSAEDTVRANELERRQLHNKIQDLKGNIRVFCRVRPTTDKAPTKHITFPGEPGSLRLKTTGSSVSGAKKDKTTTFGFDKIFGPKANQAVIFDEVGELVQSALDGYNISIFAYGP